MNPPIENTNNAQRILLFLDMAIIKKKPTTKNPRNERDPCLSLMKVVSLHCFWFEKKRRIICEFYLFVVISFIKGKF